MAIQFFCSGCGQPIEVDDNMANLAVTCPYCRKVVTTPPSSTLPSPPSMPPVPGVPMPPGAPTSPVAPSESLPYGVGPPGLRKKAVLGWIAFAGAIFTVTICAYTLQAFGGLMQGLNLQPQGQTEMQELQKTIQERAQQRPGLQVGMCAGWCLFPVSALVCGIIGLVRKEQPRWPSVASLVLLGLAIALNCLGVMRLGAMGAGGA